MANELKPYVEKVNTNETFAAQVEEAVRRSLSESGSTLLVVNHSTQKRKYNGIYQ